MIKIEQRKGGFKVVGSGSVEICNYRVDGRGARARDEEIV